MKEKPVAKWQSVTASSTPDKMLHRLFLSGFFGLLIDGYGYQDGGW